MWSYILLLALTLGSLHLTSSDPMNDSTSTNQAKFKPKFTSWSTELTPNGPQTRDVVDFDPINEKQLDNLGFDQEWPKETARTMASPKLSQSLNNPDLPTGLVNQAIDPLLSFPNLASMKFPHNSSSARWPTGIKEVNPNQFTLSKVATFPANSLDRVDHLDKGPISSHLLISQLLKRTPEAALIRLNSLLNAIPAHELIPIDHPIAIKNLLKPTPSYPQTNSKNLWLKTLVTKRRSFEPQVDQLRGTKVNFDDTLEALKTVDFDNRATGSRREYLTSLAHQLPLTYDSPSVLAKNAKFTDEDIREAALPMDHLFAGSRYSHLTYHPPTHYSYHYPAFVPHHKVGHFSRKGLEKSYGFPVLIGIGAALISFLIISNLFLSIPLFAMTLMQFLNGNNGMILPSNLIPNNSNIQPNTPNPAVTVGRKRRDVSNLEHERILRAIEANFNKY